MEKKIKFEDIMNAVEERHVNYTTEKWNGIDVTIKNTLDLNEVQTFIAACTSSCFDDNGNYIPGMLEIVTKRAMIVLYTNIDLPGTIEDVYRVMATSNIIDFVYEYINQKQYDDIVNSVRESIDYVFKTKAYEAERYIEALNQKINDITDKIASTFDGIEDGDIKAAMDVINNIGIDEEKVVESYFKHR